MPARSNYPRSFDPGGWAYVHINATGTNVRIGNASTGQNIGAVLIGTVNGGGTLTIFDGANTVAAIKIVTTNPTPYLYVNCPNGASYTYAPTGTPDDITIFYLDTNNTISNS